MTMLLVSLLAVRVAGADFPDSVQVGEERLALNGAGVRKATVFKVKAYAAALYVRQRSTSADEILRANQPKVVSLVFVRDVERKKVVEAMTAGVTRAAGAQAAELRAELDAFARWTPDFKNGQRMVITCTASGVVITASGRAEPFRAGVRFGTALVGAFIGPTAEDHELRDGLLGRIRAGA